jgi:hypothetical protein
MTVRLRFPGRPSRKQTLWGLLAATAAGVLTFVGVKRLRNTEDVASSDVTEDELTPEVKGVSDGDTQV